MYIVEGVARVVIPNGEKTTVPIQPYIIEEYDLDKVVEGAKDSVLRGAVKSIDSINVRLFEEFNKKLVYEGFLVIDMETKTIIQKGGF